MLRPIRYFIFFAFLIVTGTDLVAQNFSGHNWYFGASPRGIRFSRSDNSASLINNKVPLGMGGSAVATDQINGNLLFYTSGNDVYTAAHTIMVGGAGLLADVDQNQQVAISKVPGPGIENLYYIFHRAGGTVRVSTVDMTLNAAFPAPPLGGVVSTAAVGLGNRSDGMITIPHANGEEFWLITHDNGSPTYTVTYIKSDGTFENLPDFTFPGQANVAANFSYHELTGKIATSPQEVSRNVEILDFDNATGVLTLDQEVANSGVDAVTLGEAIYDTEWSNSGQYLYISIHGDPGAPAVQADVLQFDTRNPATSIVSALPQPNTIARSYGLQLGPDSLMYHLYQATVGGSFFVGAFSNTDTVAAAVVYDPQAFAGTLNFTSTKQFSSFAPADTVGVTVEFTTAGTCMNQPTSFYPTVSPAADSLIWSFGDATAPVVGWSPVHTYTQAGSFTPQVVAFLNGVPHGPFQRTPTPNVIITQFDLQINLVSDTTACSCELPLPQIPKPPCNPMFTLTAEFSPSAPTSIEWFGPASLIGPQTTATLTPQEAGTYYIKAGDGTCFAFQSVLIREYAVLEQNGNIWHFGHNAGIDFNPIFQTPQLPADPITGLLDTPEGCATVCDVNGQLILASDGHRVYDRTGADITPTPDPPGLGGDNESTQSVLILQVPNDVTLYYIFSTQPVEGGQHELRYSLYDLKSGPNGAVVEFNKLLFARCTERITSNGTWLIAHEFGNNSFRAYRVSAAGISNPVISALGSDHLFTPPQQGQGYMEMGGASQLAVAYSIPGVSNALEFFDFDGATGELSNFQSVDLKNSTGQVYGIEWSLPKVLATIKSPGSSTIVEVFFEDVTNIPRIVRQPPITVAEELGAIQRAPDGQTYVAVNGQGFLGSIQVNPDTLAVSNYTPSQITLDGGTTSGLGLPNPAEPPSSPIPPPGINVASVCEDNSILFTSTGRDPSIEEFSWTITDISTGNVVVTNNTDSLTHFFPDPGTFNVHLVLHNRCDPNDLIFDQIIEIFANPPVTAVPAQLLCGAPIQIEAQPASAPADNTYFWSTTGETTRVISVNNPGVFPVTTTTVNGCSSSGSVQVIDVEPTILIGADITVCQGEPAGPLVANGDLGLEYTWFIDGVDQSNPGNTQLVATGVANVFTYEVIVRDPVNDCTATDEKIVTVNPIPVFIPTGIDATGCGTNDGAIEINITDPLNTLFSYAITDILGQPAVVPGPDVSAPIIISTSTTLGTPLAAGTYLVTVEDRVTGCSDTQNAIVNDNGFVINSVSVVGACNPLTLQVTHTAAGPFNYVVFDQVNGTTVAAGTNITGSPFNIPGINEGMYSVSITTTGFPSCSNTFPDVDARQVAVASLSFGAINACDNPISIEAISNGNTFAWFDPNGVPIPGNTAIITHNQTNQGPQTYTVRVSTPGVLCEVEGTVTVNVDNQSTVAFAKSDECATTVTLTATPSPAGTYQFRWFDQSSATTPIQSSSSNQLILQQATALNGNYRVVAVNSLTGCDTEFTGPVNIIGPLQVAINPFTQIPCEGQPYSITTTLTPAGTANYEWLRNGTTITGQTTSALLVANGSGGLFTVNATATPSGCEATASISLAPADTEPGALFDNAVICPDPANPNPATITVILSADPNGYNDSYQWFQDGIADPTAIGPTYTAEEAGTYTVEMRNSADCIITDQTVVEEVCEPKIVIPTAFRPYSTYLDPVSGDYTNREFQVFTFFIDDSGFEVYIFNRWGEMVFQSTDRLFTWNGGYNNNGQLLPAGTYSYLVRYKSAYRPEDGVKEKRGGVLLVR